ncbi:hypothetical protein TNCV_4032461, partial [Trichonephila clavipes]
DTSDEDMLIYDVAEEMESPQKLTPVNEIEKFRMNGGRLKVGNVKNILAR